MFTNTRSMQISMILSIEILIEYYVYFFLKNKIICQLFEHMLFKIDIIVVTYNIKFC